jgi:hypothetical protein
VLLWLLTGDEIVTTIRNAVLASKAEGAGKARSCDRAPAATLGSTADFTGHRHVRLAAQD